MIRQFKTVEYSQYSERVVLKTTINAGGVQDVRETGSKAVDTIINSNGAQEIHDGGEALTTHIYGGAQYIDGGIADDTYIHSGTQNIDRGGKATNTYIYNGKQIVRERGTAINTTIHQEENKRYMVLQVIQISMVRSMLIMVQSQI